MKNYKVGDLVTLSAQGQSLNQNSHVYGGWGVILEVKESYHNFPIRCVWSGGNHKRPTIFISFKPYELKFFKKFS